MGDLTAVEGISGPRVTARSFASLDRGASPRKWALTALLVLLIVTIFVFPVLVFDRSRAGFVRDALFTFTLVAGVFSVAERRMTTYVLVALCAAAIVMRWIEWAVPGTLVLPLHHLATVLAIALLAFIVGKGVFTAGKVTLDRVMGAINLYLLIGIAFAVAYESIAMHMPGAFGGTTTDNLEFPIWGYFSFVTLTTVGYGDITPVAPIARSLATFEAFVGQLYPAIILARLVSLQLAPSSGQAH